MLNPTVDWSDKEWAVAETWIRGVLHTHKVTVTFTKKDGEERVMNCTLNPEFLPVVPVTEAVSEKPERKQSTTSIVVYDLDLQAWRSFTTKNVTKVSLDF